MANKSIGWLFVVLVLGCASEPSFDQGLDAAKRGDFETALSIWQPLAEKGAAEAQFNVGYLYANGLGVTKDEVVAREWYNRSAAQHHGSAAFNLAGLYLHGKGGAQDLGRARQWLGRAAVNGHTKAQNNLSLLYAGGQGVVQNDYHAIRWLVRAATAGDAAAQFNLGTRYLHGVGVAKNEPEAKAWLRKAAGQGHPKAVNDLGFMFAQGKGGTSDNVVAYALYSVSAAMKPASENPAHGNLSHLGTLLSETELAQAQSLASEMSKEGHLLPVLDAHVKP